MSRTGFRSKFSYTDMNVSSLSGVELPEFDILQKINRTADDSVCSKYGHFVMSEHHKFLRHCVFIFLEAVLFCGKEKEIFLFFFFRIYWNIFRKKEHLQRKNILGSTAPWCCHHWVLVPFESCLCIVVFSVGCWYNVGDTVKVWKNKNRSKN